MINKRWITLPVVYSRRFTSKAVFGAILKELDFAIGKVIQGLFIIDLYTKLATYRYRRGKR